MTTNSNESIQQLQQRLVPISDDDDTYDMTLMKDRDDRDSGDMFLTRERSLSSASYNGKSLLELERDTDRILDDIRNIGNDDRNSDDTQKNQPTSRNHYNNKNRKNIYRSQTSKSTSMQQQTQELDDESSNRILRISTDTSVVSCSSNPDENEIETEDGTDMDNDDDDSIVGELQRLESVTTTLRLSLIDTTNEASLLAFASSKHGGGTTPTTGTTTSAIQPPSSRIIPVTTSTTTTTTTTSTTIITTNTTNRKGAVLKHSTMHGTNENSEDYDRIIERSVPISILCIAPIWMTLLWWLYFGGDTTLIHS